MKKCPQCGQEYSDEIAVCLQDGQPLLPQASYPLPGAMPLAASSSGLAIASMILGIFSMILCGPFTGIPAVICGHMALSRSKALPTQYGGGGMAIAGLITGYIGCTIMCLALLAGLLLPAVAKAKQKALEIRCANNLKQVGLAARIWAGNHNGVLPDNFLDMTNELGSAQILICPADQNISMPASAATRLWSSNNISYEFLLPGVDANKASRQVIVRCPIHGTELYGDGSVQLVRKKRSGD